LLQRFPTGTGLVSRMASEFAAAQAELEVIVGKIAAKRAEAKEETDKNDRRALEFEIQFNERQKAEATRRVEAAKANLGDIGLAERGVATSTEDSWQEHIEPQTGNVFYYNAKTGETSWTRPTPAAQSNIINVLEKPDELPRRLAKVDDWTEHTDPLSGCSFYFSLATGETSWVKPAGQEEDWTEHIDPASGNKFYCNTSTGETSWTRPGIASKVVQCVTATLDSEWSENVDPSTGQIFYFNNVTRESSWTKPSTALWAPLQILQLTVEVPLKEAQHVTPALGNEWSEDVDPSSGQMFYFNTVTRESSWTKPSTATIYGVSIFA